MGKVSYQLVEHIIDLETKWKYKEESMTDDCLKFIQLRTGNKNVIDILSAYFTTGVELNSNIYNQERIIDGSETLLNLRLTSFCPTLITPNI